MTRFNEVLNNISQSDDEIKAEGDKVFTPAGLARQLIAATPFKEGQTLLDPAKGHGAFYDNFPLENLTSWAEIGEKKDFFHVQTKYDWLITNPPFSNLKKWLLHSCLISQAGFAYIIPLHGLTEHRVRACAELGFNITSLTVIKNPTKWELGFAMAWVVWEKTPEKNIGVLNPPKGQQTSLADF